MTTKLQENDLTDEVYKQLKGLNKVQVSQALDFIAYLKSKETKDLGRNPLIEFIMAEADTKMTLDAVREELSGIKGNLSDTIIEGREERI